MVLKTDKSEIPETGTVHKTSTVQTVVDTMLSRINDGRLMPGQNVVAQDFMDELQVSKAPVREAIHILVGEGVLELVQNRSARVRRLTHDDLIAFTEVWAAVAGVNVRLGADHIDEGDNRVQIERLLNDIRRTEQSKIAMEFFSAVTVFHRALSKMSANTYIAETIKRAHFNFFHRHITLIFPGRYWRRHMVAFEKVGVAILNGDGVAAERHYRKHMRWVIEHMQSIR